VPLPGEAGHYTVSADHPSVTDRVAQDAFDVLGMKAAGGISASLLPGQSVSGQIEVRNLSPVALHNLTAAVAESTSDSAAFSASSTASAAPAERDETRTTLWLPARADSAQGY